MRSHSLRRAGVTLLASLMVHTAVHAQPPREPPVDSASIESFAKAHLAVSTLRAQLQAQLAVPKAKTREEQVTLRDKLRVNTLRALREHAWTESTFAAMTQRVSTDSSARRAFESALARLSGGKAP